jgi:hypothetical protein
MTNPEEVLDVEVCDKPTPEAKSEAVQPYMIRPVVKVEEALEAWREYQNLKDRLADKGDFVNIQGKQHPTKQFANKLSKFFGLSVEIVRADKETAGEHHFVWHIWARATAPNGQFRDGDGHCSSDERRFSHLYHDVYATAVTRAKNRAILELAGFGEVTAEEMGNDTNEDSPHPSSLSPSLSPKTQGRTTTGAGTAASPSPSASTDSAFKDRMGAFEVAKGAIGEVVYYQILESNGVRHANALKTIADMDIVLNEMRDYYAKTKGEPK